MVGKGWTDACFLQQGDRLYTRHGGTVAVEEVYDTGEYETVYNCRVADWHTYFVGSEEWGFSVWAHNSYGIKSKSYASSEQGCRLRSDAMALRGAYFTLRDTRLTLAAATLSGGLEGVIYAGLEALTTDLLSRPWRRDDGVDLRIDRCLIDAN
ncbi:MAG: polymorphic toxin-type HINT domain-containing protein [Thermogemmata sp.]|nr:polymorphic toxin-type HINT domain-containing protein [Thermogemmata sp.]